MMAPNTATKLKQSTKNVLKDFVHVAGPLGVTHFILLSATHNASYMRICKSPRGPTITMRIHEYSLIRDILASQQRPRSPQSIWLNSPLVVLSGFTAPTIPKEDLEHLKLTSIMFQNMFPSINAATTKLSACQRVLLLEYSPETKKISLRQYSVGSTPSGVTKSLKTLVTNRGIPDMGSLADVSEFLTRSGYGSESEGEDAEMSRVQVAEGQQSSFGVRQTRIRLYEIGPRMELEVIKVEEGLCDGKVLFHKYIKKSKKEVEVQENEIEARRRERERRRRQQEENVRRKQKEKELKEQAKALKGGKKTSENRKRKDTKKSEKQPWWEKNLPYGQDNDNNGNDDVEWYRKEVGETPDEDFIKQKSRKRDKKDPLRKA